MDKTMNKKTERPEQKAQGRLADLHWKEVMNLAERYGFLAQAYGGTAVLLTHRVQLEEYGVRGYLCIQKTSGHCAKDLGYPGCLTDDHTLQDCRSCAIARQGAKWVHFEPNPDWKPLDAT